MAPSRALPRLNTALRRVGYAPPPRRTTTVPSLDRDLITARTIKRVAPCAFFSISSAARNVEPPDHLDESELKIFKKLNSELSPTSLEVQDISGGCGSMYGLDIVSPKFDGLSVIKQHKLVNQILAEDIKGWHGVQLKTRSS